MSDDFTDASSAGVLRRYEGNPILSAQDVPYACDLVFNAGVCKLDGRYVMVFRNDYGWRGRPKGFEGTNLGLAFSDDGLKWRVQERPCWQWHDDEVVRVYDPRLTLLDGQCWITFALDTRHGVRGGLGVTEDFERFEVVHLTAPDNRNIVLLPRRVDGDLVRLERPMPVYSRGGDRFDIWLSRSRDGQRWSSPELVLAVEDVPFANDKIGPAAPPVWTEQGWLTTFHAVERDDSRGKNGWEDRWQKRYFAGLMLLDRRDPSKVVGLARQPLLTPLADYETQGGFRNDVIFPTGMIVEDDGQARIYYGAADTVMCLATADVNELVSLCEPV
ncbi:MAG: glycoside hydrolase family 130 protein [Phycisphaerae bacterium]